MKKIDNYEIVDNLDTINWQDKGGEGGGDFF